MPWWRGPDGEDEMTEDDWKQRGEQQASAMFAGQHWTNSNPDEDGDNTAGWYNGDYTDEQHDEANKRLDEDEYYEAENTEAIRPLWGWFLGRDGET